MKLEKLRTVSNSNLENEKILLTILPYWDPMIPPMGITSLKSYLEKFGYKVKTADLIVKKESLDFYDNYFKVLKNCIPEHKQGNFNNIGHDVLQNHMMAHLRYKDLNDYIELVKILIYKTYYVKINDESVNRLIKLVEDFYIMLENCFSNLLEEEKPDVVGTTVYKCTLPASMFVLKLTKEKYPHIKTIMGGGTFNDNHALDSPNFKKLLEETENYIDKIFIGQGEKLLLKYLRNELEGAKRVYTIQDIQGKIVDFEELDVPDFSDLDIQKYPYLAATASSGCIYNCSFCVSAKVSGKYRRKKPEQTVEEMSELQKRYGKQLFFMTDSLLNPVVTDLAEEMIRKKKSLYYDAYFKVDNESSDIRSTLLWRRGGLYRVRLGTESGSQKILNEMNKGITVNQIKSTLSTLAYAGIKTTTYWVIGHPGETEEDFQMTLDLIEELKNDIFQAECNPFLYHYSQQSHADKWAKYRTFLYPEKTKDMLIFESYTLDYEPVRKIAYERMNRFEKHCRKLGIPNPYSYKEHIEADKRWQKLHENAVPSIMEFIKQNRYINENLNIKIPTYSKNLRLNEDESFCF